MLELEPKVLKEKDLLEFFHSFMKQFETDMKGKGLKITYNIQPLLSAELKFNYKLDWSIFQSILYHII